VLVSLKTVSLMVWLMPVKLVSPRMTLNSPALTTRGTDTLGSPLLVTSLAQ
jgi:hypothetical protein